MFLTFWNILLSYNVNEAEPEAAQGLFHTQGAQALPWALAAGGDTAPPWGQGHSGIY